MTYNFMTAAEAASLIKDGEIIALSGFTPAGSPKAVTAELARQAEEKHARGEHFQVLLRELLPEILATEYSLVLMLFTSVLHIPRILISAKQSMPVKSIIRIYIFLRLPSVCVPVF